MPNSVFRSAGYARRMPLWAFGAMACCAGNAFAQAPPALRGAVPDGLTLPDRPSVAPPAATRLPAGSPAEDSLASPDLRPAIPDDDPTADPVDPLIDDMPRPAEGERTPVVDGDMTLPEERNAIARDGIIEVGEPPAPQDGADPTVIDSRPQEEADLFTNAADTLNPAGFDPLLFQIEDINPLRTDRRPARLFTIEPYDPVGVRVGSFVFFPEVSLGGEGTSNVLRLEPADPDVSAEFATRARLVSNWDVHALEFNATGLTSFHNEFPSENDAFWNVEARGRLDVTRRTNLQGLVSHDVRQEGRAAIDAAITGDRATITTDSADLTLNHRFNRLSVQLRGGYDDIDFGPSAGGSPGIPANPNDDRDTQVGTQAVRTTWQFRPTFSVYGEVETNQRRYEIAALSDNLSRDSNGERYRAGIDFGTTGRTVRGEMSIGYGSQDLDDPGLSDVDGVLIDGNVAWRMSELTTLRFLARTDIFDTNSEGSGGVMTRTAGIEARHAFRRYVVGTAGITYTDFDFDNVDISESELRTSLMLEYYVNREWTLFGEWDHIRFDSTQPNGTWTADDLRVGARWRQ